MPIKNKHEVKLVSKKIGEGWQDFGLKRMANQIFQKNNNIINWTRSVFPK